MPKGYRFIFLALHGCGAGATQIFFQQCNIKINTRFNADMQDYAIVYDFLRYKKPNDYIAIWLRAYNFEDDKLYYLITEKVPILCVVRDPISLIKPFINHLGGNGYNRVSTISLNDDYGDIILPAAYLFFSKEERLSVEKLDRIITYIDEHEYFMAKKLKLLEKNIESFHYIPFEDISIEHAFSTFCSLAKQFGFNPPKDKKPFQTKLNGSNRYVLFPFVLECDKKRGIALHVVLHTDRRLHDSRFCDITNLMLERKPQLDYNLSIIIENTYYKDFLANTNLLERAQSFLRGYMAYLEQMEHTEKSQHITEEAILTYLRNNKEVSRHLMQIFKREYAHINTHRKDIVDTWKYYQEFIAICKAHNL